MCSSSIHKCLDNFEVEHVLGSDYVHTSDLFNTFMNTATAHAIIVEYPHVPDFHHHKEDFLLLTGRGLPVPGQHQ